MQQDLSRRAFAVALATVATLPSLAMAQAAYPARPVTIVVAFAAGGNNDLRARQLGIPVGAMLGQPVIVDNKPGASGNIGHDFVAKRASRRLHAGHRRDGPAGGESLAVHQAELRSAEGLHADRADRDVRRWCW
jgi:hypothetical protein